MYRLNSHNPPLRQATDTGHGAYDRPAPTRGDQPGWQLPPCKASGPEHDAAVVFAHLAAEQEALSSIELDVDRRKRKRRTVGRPGVAGRFGHERA